MHDKATPQMLRELQVGNDLPETDQIELASIANVVSFNADERVFREGDKHSFIYWLLDGSISLEMSSGVPAAKALLTLGHGDILAWSAFLAGGRMTATARVAEPTRLVRLDIQELRNLCQANHEIGFRVMEHLASQLAQRLLATRLQLLDLFHSPNGSNE
ncbi:CRP-like cAMP-binding protein [Rhodopirellula rubra]|uniref:CRP-like cAMP-binding protein n=1 Tax=Aporhodopirellula rubra TaxID=980271 RepID=A0A7W5DYM9_9BACT|nr:cyclic nucleotide-binding domain-containing protein [Aporhodopirellula rubra]MBB3206042.1 CRP-like cAMP-binding protein [Aporhodopirellula rubra]